MPIVFDEVVGEIAPEPTQSPTPEEPSAGGDDHQLRALIRTLARERWKRDRLRAG